MSSTKARTKDEALALAAERGLVALFPLPHELTMDYDMPFDEAVIKYSAVINSGKTAQTLKKIAHHGGLMFISQLWTESSNGNAHLYIVTNQLLDDTSKCFYQALLGSDTTRELYNYIRMNDNKNVEKPYSMALFETPKNADVVRRWRVKCQVERALYRINKVKYAMHPPHILAKVMADARTRMKM